MPAPHRLYPLLMKPGILRDGTAFQGEYCTDGQWVRFQNGRPRTMGGYEALPSISYKGGHPAILNLKVFYAGGDRYLAVYYGELRKGSGYVDIYKQAEKFIVHGGSPNGALFEGPVMYEGRPHLIIDRVQDFNDIESDVEPALYLFPLVKDTKVEQFKLSLDIKDAQGQRLNLNGGVRYVPPYLFLWGMDGAVAWSSPSDIKNFAPQDTEGKLTGAGVLTLSNDKVIQGYPLRGGAQSPAVLFWTLNSVVRLLNVGVDQVIFKADVISKNVSLLSRQSVIEVDGLFFWPGTDRFFVYNGTVQEVPNSLNLNGFYDHLDMSRRQQVVGVRNPKYGELWWFYPDKREGKPYNTRAVIYNKRENTWVDTKINRDAAWYDDASGTLFAAGQDLTENGLWQVWQHEQGTCGVDYQRKVFPIPSSLDSPVISWVSVSPQKEEIGLDRRITLERLEPDFKMTKGVPDGRKEPEIAVSVIVQDYAQSPVNVQKLGRIVPGTEHLDPRIEGRQMRLRFESEDAFEMGNVLLQFDVGAAQ